MSLRRRIPAVAAVLACGLVPTPAVVAEVRPVTVFAAASLTNALDELGMEFARKTGIPVRSSFAASSILARQIEAGARADVFVSADQEWMDYLVRRAKIQASTRHDLLGNRLALIAPVESRVQLTIERGFPLAAALGQGRLATGDPDGVPVGRYAMAALMSLGVWDTVSDRLVRAEDVRHALRFVARGEVPLGIVYETDARIDKRVRIVGIFPADTHLPITYPVALTNAASADAVRFVDFIRSDAGRKAFERYGFTVLR